MLYRKAMCIITPLIGYRYCTITIDLKCFYAYQRLNEMCLSVLVGSFVPSRVKFVVVLGVLNMMDSWKANNL